MAAKHTKGPWQVNTRQVGFAKETSVWTEHSDPIAHIATVTNGPANADLIAAAPELYDALDRALWLLRAICGTSGEYPDEREIIAAGTAALAKARGSHES